MSEFGFFEVLASAPDAEQEARQNATDRLAAATYDVREQFGPFLFAARNVREYRDRAALVKEDAMRVVQAHLMPVTGVMRRIGLTGSNGTLEKEFRTRLAADHRVEDFTGHDDNVAVNPYTGDTESGEFKGNPAGRGHWESGRAARRKKSWADSGPTTKQYRPAPEEEPQTSPESGIDLDSLWRADTAPDQQKTKLPLSARRRQGGDGTDPGIGASNEPASCTVLGSGKRGTSLRAVEPSALSTKYSVPQRRTRY